MNASMDNTNIFIIPQHARFLKKIQKFIPQNQDFFWMFLGTDVAFDLAARNLLGSTNRIRIGKDIQKAANEYRHDYIDAIGNLAQKNSGYTWWLSTVSEKNPFISNVFLNFCYIKAALSCIKSDKKNIIIICESRNIISILKHCFDQEIIRVVVIDSTMANLLEQVYEKINQFIRIFWFILYYCIRIACARFFKFFKGDRKRILKSGCRWTCIHSWADQRSFKRSSPFTDIYFGELGKKIRDYGGNVFYLVNILPTYSYLKGLLNLIRSREQIILFEEFITPVDIFFTIIHDREYLKRPYYVEIGGLDISGLIQAENKKDIYSTRQYWNHLCFFASLRVAKKIRIERFFYTFENHSWEKMFCHGFNVSSPATRLIGYAHTIVHRMYTSYSVSQAEQNCMPLPDYIIVNGKAAAEVLTHSGFDPGMILIGGALRYPHLFREPLETAVNSQKRQSRNAVITASSAGFEEALELIFYTIHTFGKFTEIPVILKLHPTIPVKAVLRHLKQIPINFSFSDEPLEFLIGKCMFFMYTSSAAALEAFAGGATLIHVKSEYRIDMNIFDNEESILSVDSGLEIDSAFIQMLKDKRSPGQNERKSIINKYFMPVNESVYQLFINT